MMHKENQKPIFYTRRFIMKKARIIALALIIAMAVMAFTGCGQKQSALERIKESGELVMLTNAAFAPFEYLGSDNEVAGVDVEIAKAIAEELGVTLKIVDMDFDGIITSIQSCKGDIGASGITANDERRKSVDFSINYVDAAQYIIVKSDNTAINGPDDLAGKNVGAQTGTTGEVFLSDETEAVVYRFKTAADAAMELSNGKLDAVVVDELPAQQIVATYSGLKIIETPLTEEQYAIAIAKGNEDLKEVVDKVISELLASGKIDQWIQEHKVASGS
jgi:ABC-type amino acid transport substrate-binding protein